MAKPPGKADLKALKPGARGRDEMTGSVSNLYEVQGDSKAALEAYGTVSADNLSQVYNKALLSFVSSGGEDRSFMNQLEEWKAVSDLKDEALPPLKRLRKQWIVAYNESLVQFVSGQPRESAVRLITLLRSTVTEKGVLPNELHNVGVRMAFLVMDCILATESHVGLKELDMSVTSDSIIDWLDNQDLESAPQLKFMLTLYKSRVDFAARENGKLVDAKVRAAKKELKTAMELFTHKLRDTGGEGGSVGSQSDVLSENSNSLARPSMLPSSLPSAGTPEGLVQSYNQSALNLKAHLEQLKGNTKKSLILCQEAQLTHHDPTYQSIDANNLSVVYATSRKRHLALHTIAKALRSDKDSGAFRSDGTASYDNKYAILHNASLCAFQGQNYKSAYECMAACVQNSLMYRQRPRCWLRMVEACIGLYAMEKKKDIKSEKRSAFSTIEANGKPQGLYIGGNHSEGSASTTQETGMAGLGSMADIEFVVKEPLKQAAYCLDVVMKLLRDPSAKKDPDCLESARCSQAFVKLEMKEYKQALIISKLVLMDAAHGSRGSGLHTVMHKRRQATASLYACEASCALGDTRSALKFLTGEKQDESALDRLAMDLAGVKELASAANNATMKARYKRAQAIVRTSASAASASMGALGAAKNLAMSAISLEDDRSLLSSDRSSARKALLYCMLREGNRDGALAVLRSSR